MSTVNVPAINICRKFYQFFFTSRLFFPKKMCPSNQMKLKTPSLSCKEISNLLSTDTVIILSFVILIY